MQLVDEINPILREPCLDFNFESPAIDPILLVEQMRDVMLTSKGIGLAAPQVGLDLKVFLVDQMSCFNPKIIKFSDEIVSMEEGCLSFPGLYLSIERPAEVVVSYYDEHRNYYEVSLDGIHARCFQHEFDHINGKVFTSHVSRLKLGMAEKKRRKFLRRL